MHYLSPKSQATAKFFLAIGLFLPLPVFGGKLGSGTNLEVRLSAPTGSRISHPGDTVEATVIAPVVNDGVLLIPQGAKITGKVDRVERLGFGIKHLTAAIDYRFNRVTLPSGQTVGITAKVVQVETAKERVDSKGEISGIYPTVNLSSSLMSSVIPILCVEPHFGLSFMGVKVLIARSPDPEIYYPAGTELILELTSDLEMPEDGRSEEQVGSLSTADLAEAEAIISRLPEQHTNNGSNHPSDLVNILFLGDRESVNRAFHAAGWLGAQRSSLLSIYRMYHSMVQRMGYDMAPMSMLTLNGHPPSEEYQKGLNTFSKRHHTRLWKQPEEDAWVSAATEDVDYKVRKMHLTHATDAYIDNERNKVLNDMIFTGCVSSAALLPREMASHAPGAILTDGGVAVVRLNDCREPRGMPDGAAHSGQRPRAVQALVALRNDFIRANPAFVSYNSAKLLWVSRGLLGHHAEPQVTPGKGTVLESSVLRWQRPSVLDTMEFRSGDSPRLKLLENRLFLPAIPPDFDH